VKSIEPEGRQLSNIIIIDVFTIINKLDKTTLDSIKDNYSAIFAMDEEITIGDFKITANNDFSSIELIQTADGSYETEGPCTDKTGSIKIRNRCGCSGNN